MNLADQLKTHRECLDLSQNEVAKRIFVSRQTISSWETGKTCPDVQSLLLLSNLFGVSIDELVKGDMEAMASNVEKDSETLKRLGWTMLALIAATIVSASIAIILRDIGVPSSYGMSMGSLVAILMAGAFFLCAFAAAVRAEVLKRQNDIVTYREIVAFTQGIRVEEARGDATFGRRHPGVSAALKVCLGAAAGLTACIFFSALAKGIRDLIFSGLA